MKKLTSKPILKRASGILNQAYATPKDIAWAWVTLLLSQEETKRGGVENHFSRVTEFEQWILALKLPSDPKDISKVSPKAVKNSAKMVYEWPHDYVFEDSSTSKKSTVKVVHKDAITQPILDAIKAADGAEDKTQLMAILEGYAKEGVAPFVEVTAEGIAWKGENWLPGEPYHLLTLKSLNNRLTNLRKKQLI